MREKNQILRLVQINLDKCLDKKLDNEGKKICVEIIDTITNALKKGSK